MFNKGKPFNENFLKMPQNQCTEIIEQYVNNFRYLFAVIGTDIQNKEAKKILLGNENGDISFPKENYDILNLSLHNSD